MNETHFLRSVRVSTRIQVEMPVSAMHPKDSAVNVSKVTCSIRECMWYAMRRTGITEQLIGNKASIQNLFVEKTGKISCSNLRRAIRQTTENIIIAQYPHEAGKPIWKKI